MQGQQCLKCILGSQTLRIGSYCNSTCVSSFIYTGLYFKIKRVKIHKIDVLCVGICMYVCMYVYIYIYIYIYKLFVSQYRDI